jgi:hypothetical protein
MHRRDIPAGSHPDPAPYEPPRVFLRPKHPPWPDLLIGHPNISDRRFPLALANRNSNRPVAPDDKPDEVAGAYPGHLKCRHKVAHVPIIGRQFDPNPRLPVGLPTVSTMWGDGQRPSNTGERTPGPVRTGELPDQAPRRPVGRGNQPGAARRLERELTAWRPDAGVLPREIDCVPCRLQARFAKLLKRTPRYGEVLPLSVARR